jgi:hypothetical protein
MKKLAGLAVFALLWSGAIQAASTLANPQLQAFSNGIHDAAHERELRLRRFEIAVEIRGGVAETTIDATFANPTDDTLEGDFRLILPRGAVVTGYALNIGNQLVEGVLVDRPRAKAVYDARVRRGVDPGLAEVTADNVFETHVNPILPQQGRRIRLRFVTPIGTDGCICPSAWPRRRADGRSPFISAARAGRPRSSLAPVAGGSPWHQTGTAWSPNCRAARLHSRANW